jgi:hypothetical protein
MYQKTSSPRISRISEAQKITKFASPCTDSSCFDQPDLMSAAEIVEALGVARQRLHQLRSTAAFPAPLAELRGGAVWDAAAVRKFARGVGA